MQGPERVTPVVWVLVALSLLPELVLSGADLGLWGDTDWRAVTFQYAGFWSGLLGNWQPNYAAQPYLMFATYGFLHAGLLHLAVNMITLVSLSRPLTARLGTGRFAALYAVSLVGGGVGFVALNTAPVPMVGASGALFGLAGALLALEFQRRIDLGRSLLPIGQALLWLAALNLILWWAMDGRLAWETHLGGFIFGWVFAVVGRPQPRT